MISASSSRATARGTRRRRGPDNQRLRPGEHDDRQLGLLLRATALPGVTGVAAGDRLLGPPQRNLAPADRRRRRRRADRDRLRLPGPRAQRHRRSLSENTAYKEAVAALGRTPISGFVDGPAALHALAWCPPKRFRAKPYLTRSATSRSARGRRPGDAKLIAGSEVGLAGAPASASTCSRSSDGARPGAPPAPRRRSSRGRARYAAGGRPAAPGGALRRQGGGRQGARALGGFGFARSRSRRRAADRTPLGPGRSGRGARRDLAHPLARPPRRCAPPEELAGGWSRGSSRCMTPGERAVDRWAIEEQGVPSPQLMEAAARRWRRRSRGFRPGAGADRLRQGQQRRGRGDRRRASWRRWVSRSRWRTSSGGRGARQISIAGWRRGGGGRCDLRDRLRGCAARAGAARSRRSIAAGRRWSPATSPPGSTPPAARSPGSRSRRTSRSASTPPSSASGSPRASGTCGELRVVPIGIPPGAPVKPVGGDDRAGGPGPGAAPRRALDQVQLRPGDDRRRLARADRGGADVLDGGDQGRGRIRDRRRPRRSRAGLRSRAARGDVGRLPGRRRLPGARLRPRRCCGAFERAAAGVFGPGLGRDPARWSWRARSVARDRGAAGARRRRPQRLRRRPELLAGRPATTILTPHAGELGACWAGIPGEVAAHRLAAARRPPRAAAPSSSSRATTRSSPTGERVAVNALAAPGLATAGSGDVLSGVTAALLARGLEPFAAACAAVLAHARAGRDAAAQGRQPPSR